MNVEKIVEILSRTPPWLQEALFWALAALAGKWGVEAIGSAFAHVGEGMDWLFQKWNETTYGRRLRADDLVYKHLRSVILGLQDTVVDSLKRESADNKLTVTDIQKIGLDAYEAVKKSMSSQDWSDVTRALGEDAKNIILARIPGLVATLKTEGLINHTKSSVAPAKPPEAGE